MGFFGPPRPFRERTFTMPCSRAEAMTVILGVVDHEGHRPFARELLPGPPLVQTIYLESCDDDGLVVAAGNRATTWWRMRLALAGDNPTSGTFGVIEHHDSQWLGNVMSMNFALRSAIRSVGGDTGRWPM